MHPDVGYGAVDVGLVDYVGLSEVVGLAGVAQDFGLQESEAGESPAGARAVLVLDGGDGDFLYNGELGGVGIVCHHGGAADERGCGYHGRKELGDLHNNLLCFGYLVF